MIPASCPMRGCLSLRVAARSMADWKCDTKRYGRVMKRIFRTGTFSHWMNKTGLADADACQSVIEMESGLIDAELGAHVVKKRVALHGRGKREGARTIVATNRGSRWYFILGFGKNKRGNIGKQELRARLELAQIFWDMATATLPPRYWLTNLGS